MTVNAFLGLLAQKSVWKYETEFRGFTDKYKAKVTSIVPKLTEDGRPLLVIYGTEEKWIRKWGRYERKCMCYLWVL